MGEDFKRVQIKYKLMARWQSQFEEVTKSEEILVQMTVFLMFCLCVPLETPSVKRISPLLVLPIETDVINDTENEIYFLM